MKKILFILNLILISLLISFPSYALEGDIVGPDVIYKEADKILTLSTITPLYSSTLGEITILNDVYTGHGDVPGIYEIELGVSGQVITKTIDVSVRSTIGNVIAVTQTGESYTIILHKNYILTQNDIVDILVNVQMISYSSTTEIYILTDTYSANKDAPGSYIFEFHLANATGFEDTYEITIQVNDSEKLLPDIIETEVNVSSVLKNILYISLSLGALVGTLYLIRKVSRKAKARKGVFS